MLNIPSDEKKQQILLQFNDDMKSFHVEIPHPSTGETVIQRAFCSVCDSIPDRAHFAEWVPVQEFKRLCEKSNMGKKRLLDRGIYKDSLINWYTANSEELQDFILSPESVINNETDSILVCKKCKDHMNANTRKRSPIEERKPPIESIANAYLIGAAPKELTCLNEVELSIVSRVRIYAHTWVFFAGCHQQIRGWHTFFKNRHTSNVADLHRLQDAGVDGNIMVILCGPFTSTQRALTMEATKVDPVKVLAAFRWLKENNFYYQNDEIPNVDELPQVQIIQEEV